VLIWIIAVFLFFFILYSELNTFEQLNDFFFFVNFYKMCIFAADQSYIPHFLCKGLFCCHSSVKKHSVMKVRDDILMTRPSSPTVEES